MRLSVVPAGFLGLGFMGLGFRVYGFRVYGLMGLGFRAGLPCLSCNDNPRCQASLLQHPDP